MEQKNTDQNLKADEESSIHPLSRSWTLWHDPPIKNKECSVNWENRLKHIGTFQTVEDFWGIFNALKDSWRIHGSMYMFRTDIKPMWEDPENENGGIWMFQISTPNNVKINSNDLEEQRLRYNDCWIKMILSCIGDMYDDLNGEICGCASNNKKNDVTHILRINLWIRSADDSEIVKKIGNKLKKLLNLDKDDCIKFYVHRETALKGVFKTPYRFIL